MLQFVDTSDSHPISPNNELKSCTSWPLEMLTIPCLFREIHSCFDIVNFYEIRKDPWLRIFGMFQSLAFDTY